MLKDARPQATRDGGHTVLIVGCNEDEAATEFPYVDPYPGGIATDSYPSKCFFLGLFKVELPMRGPVLRSHRDSDGEWSGQEAGRESSATGDLD